MTTPDEFIHAVREHLFVRGYDCSNPYMLHYHANCERAQFGVWPEVTHFVDQCIHEHRIAYQPERNGKRPSSNAGASERWLAVHEAGHAVVGIRTGLTMYGIRFYGDGGPPGEAGFEEFAWHVSTNENHLRRVICVDVAANLAEMLLGVREPDGGLPSQFWDKHDRMSDCDCPSDIRDAWLCSRRLAIIQFKLVNRQLEDGELFRTRRAIVEQAEAEANQILYENRDVLNNLADRLKLGPLTGAQVRAVVGV